MDFSLNVNEFVGKYIYLFLRELHDLKVLNIEINYHRPLHQQTGANRDGDSIKLNAFQFFIRRITHPAISIYLNCYMFLTLLSLSVDLEIY